MCYLSLSSSLNFSSIRKTTGSSIKSVSISWPNSKVSSLSSCSSFLQHLRPQTTFSFLDVLLLSPTYPLHPTHTRVSTQKLLSPFTPPFHGFSDLSADGFYIYISSPYYFPNSWHSHPNTFWNYSPLKLVFPYSSLISLSDTTVSSALAFCFPDSTHRQSLWILF